jgi:hypothetical protein
MFLRVLKQKNKTTVSYKMAVVESFRENGKVWHRILLYIGTFPEKYRHQIEYRRRFIKKLERKLAEADFLPYKKTEFRLKIYDILPEIKETIEADRKINNQRRGRRK